MRGQCDRARAVATLTRPNTVQVYGYGRAADGTFFYATVQRRLNRARLLLAERLADLRPAAPDGPTPPPGDTPPP